MKSTAVVSPSLVLVVVCLAALGLHLPALVRPVLRVDDFQILARSWTWERTVAALGETSNEHVIPCGRLTTWLLVQAAGEMSCVPFFAEGQGGVALVVAVALLYVFASREFASPAHGLLAALAFGVTGVYAQAVVWFAASLSVVSLDVFLLSLLAAQRWRLKGGVGWGLLCAAATALAPTWFASGVLAGPLVACYLLFSNGDDEHPLIGRRRLGRALVPLAGTTLFLALSLPHTAGQIMHLEHYRDGPGTALAAFRPLVGLESTYRSVVDNLLLGVLGFSAVDVPVGLVFVAWQGVTLALLLAWRRAPAGRPFLLLGMATIFAAYLLVYSARAAWGYEGFMNRPNWGRYHLLPQFGLALVVAAGSLAWLRPEPVLSRRRAYGLLAAAALLFAVQLRLALAADWAGGHAEQQEALRSLDALDARCRRHRVGAEAASQALPPFEIPGADGREDGRRFLRGAADADPSLTADDARRLLAAEE